MFIVFYYTIVSIYVSPAASMQRRRAIEALEARAPPPQYCDCGPDWPLLFKVHEI